jgi:hypothetical protein
MMTLRRDHLTRDEALTVARIADGVPRLAEAAAPIDELRTTIRKRKPDIPAAEGGTGSVVLLRPRAAGRQEGGRRRHGRALAERPRGGPVQPPEDPEAPDARPGQARPAPGEHGRCLTEESCTEIEPEPNSDADRRSEVDAD